MFEIPVVIPSSKQICRVRNFNNHQYLTLQKYIFEGNEDEILTYFDNLLEVCTNADIHSLNCIDKFVLLLKLRCISINSDIQLTLSESTITISLENVINNITAVDHVESIYSSKDIQLSIGMPTRMVEHQSDIIPFIKSINGIDVRNIPQEYSNQIFSLIPQSGELNKFVNTFKQQVIDKFSSIYIVFPIPTLEYKGISFHPFINLVDTLKGVYAEDLTSIYRLKYISMTKLNTSPSEYDAMSPADSRVFINMYSQEINDKNNQLNAGA
jgi:hypothetical protein